LDIIALTPFQEGLYYHSMLEGTASGEQAHLQQIVFQIEGNLDRQAFERAWNVLVERHDILRTLYRVTRNGQAAAIVLKERKLRLHYTDCRQFSGEEQARTLSEQTLFARRYLDLGSEESMRLHLIQRSDQDHLLIWTFHHILFDGWCQALLQQELATAYQAIGQGIDPVPLPRASSFTHYVRWLQSRNKAEAREFWTRHLALAPEPRPLPGFKTQDSRTRQHRTESFTLDKTLSDDLRGLAARLGVSLRSVMLGVWGILIAGLTQADTVVLGVVASLRPLDIPGMDRLVGPCITTLPLRLHASARCTLESVYRQIHDLTPEWLRHAHFPLSEIHGHLKRRELFNHIVAFENFPVAAADEAGRACLGPGLHLQACDSFMPNSYGLTVIILPETAIRLSFAHDAALYEPEAIRGLGERYRHLCQSAIEASSLSLAQLNLLSAVEWQALQQEFIQPVPSRRACNSVYARRQVWMAARREQPALWQGTLNLRHDEVETWALNLAAWLASGLVSDHTRPLALVADAGIEMVVGMLACLYAGRPFVPLAPDLPALRREWILSDCEAFLLERDTILQARSRMAVGYTPASDQTDLPAYIIYTSGTTGQPKGVQVGQHALLNYVGWLERDMDTGPGDVSILLSSPAFDLGYTSLFGTLLNGGTLVLLNEAGRRDPEYIIDCMIRHRVSFLKTTPSLFDLIVNSPDFTRMSQSDSLERVFLGGEPLHFKTLKTVQTQLPGIRIINHYGPTEATIGCIAGLLPATWFDEGAALLQCLGRPIAGCRILICNHFLQPVPAGIPGEILVSGEGLSQGYIGAARNQSQRFLDIPLLPGVRMYRTGDQAYWLADGRVVFLGRQDQQIKIRGYRVELEEIQSALLAYEGLREAVVLERDQVLYAFITGTADQTALRHHLAERLSDYMIPRHLIFLETLPLTANNKLDTAFLLERAHTPQVSPDCEAVVEPVVMSLISLWQRVLGTLQPISAHSDFFTHGGHSLLAIQLVSLIRAHFDCPLGLADILTASTPATLARLIQSRSGSTPGLSLLRLDENPTGVLLFMPSSLGSPGFFRPLLAQLNQPVMAFGVFSSGFEETGDSLDDSLANLARRIVDSLPATIRHLPVCCIGWSFGGAVALETMALLEKAGYRVQAVLLDADIRLPGEPVEPVQPTRFADLAGHPYWTPLLQTLRQHLSNAQYEHLERLAGNNERILGRFCFEHRLSGSIACIEARLNGRSARMEKLACVTAGSFQHDRIEADHYTLLEEEHWPAITQWIERLLLRDHDT